MKFGKRTHFDDDFMRQNLMGPSCLRLIDELTTRMNLQPAMRVLDLGCGTGLTSIFLAQEFGVQVFATDLWISPSANYARIRQFGLEDRVIPIHGEAHALPYAHGYFDAAVSIDAYTYFGAAPDYLDTHLIPLVKKGGTIAASIPGLQWDLTDGVPEVLKPFWTDDINFYSGTWWKARWAQSSHITITDCFLHNCHNEAWKDWLQCDNPYAQRDIAMIEAEDGKYFDTIGLIATVK